jgi:ligand-binding SRPBCC domain-containing protein
MPVIKIEMVINAPIEVVFDLSRSIDLHAISTVHTGEQAIAGKTSGLIGMGESVTWKAKHFGVTQLLTSKITGFNAPFYFSDEMVSGAFKAFKHEHILKEQNGMILMTDIFTYKSPYGILGRLADVLFLKSYMKDFLLKRNQTIKEYAEDTLKAKSVLSL